ELVEGMKPGGIAILNADDPLVAAMQSLSKGRTIAYGIENEAEVRAENIQFERFGETNFTLVLGASKAFVTYPLNGKHNILNALAAAAVGLTFGMTAEEIASSLRSVAAPPQRGEVLHFKHGFAVINDSYNSNPTALMSMVETLVDGAGARRKIVVAGEMLELGPDSGRIHNETGMRIAGKGVDVLIGVRGLAKEMVEGAKAAGLDAAEFAVDAEAAADRVSELASEGDVILIKGSRGVRTEKVIEKLLKNFELEEEAEATL
ncbi:MAG: Mur ligase family protein, partial [Acidobacteriota bacterium]